MGKDIDLIAGMQRVFLVGDKQLSRPAYTHDDGAQRGKQVGQFMQRGVEHRAVFIQRHPQKLRLAVEKAFGIKRLRRRQPLQRGLCHLSLRRDHHVNRQMVAAIEIGIDRIQITLRPQPRDLAGDAKDRMGDLADHHVDLI